MEDDKVSQVSRRSVESTRIRRLRLKNYRMFADLSLDLAPRFTLLIGRNGSGKTTVIEALAVGLSWAVPEHEKGYFLQLAATDVHAKIFGERNQLFIERQFPAEIELEAVLGGRHANWVRRRTAKTRRTSPSEELDAFCDSVERTVSSGGIDSIPVFAWYYVERFFAQPPRKRPRFQKAGSRFIALTNAFEAAGDHNNVVSWWKTQEYEAFRSPEGSLLPAVRKAVLNCVDGASDIVFDFKSEQILVKLHGNWVELDHASSGYREFIMLVADLAWRAAVLNPRLSPDEVLKSPGVVAIDELDVHLHPEWQRRVVYDLMMTFPNMQFICSTHSPFVIQGMPPSPEVSIIRLDDLKSIRPEAMTLEDVAEYIQQVSDVHRGYPLSIQAGKIASALQKTKRSPGEGSADLEGLISEEPFDPATKALLEIERLALQASRNDQ